MRGRTMSQRQRRRTRAVAAFTLIEVLMSIFVLALGLLGLGALIPGIIREQRVASDRTLGIVVANDAKTYLNARSDLLRLGLKPPVGTGLSTGTGREFGFGSLLLDDEWSPTYTWDLASLDVNLYEDEGNVVIGDPVDTVDPARIPLSDRLYPTASSNLDEPQFVWDFVARRLPPTEDDGFALLADSEYTLTPSTPEQWRAGLEIAVFVRRVDTGIRVPAGETGYTVMLGLASTTVLPVGITEMGALTGAGGDTGQNQIYAPPMTLAAEYDGVRSNVLRLDGDAAPSGAIPGGSVTLENRLRLASQVGQQLVDNLGNVYTVEEVLSSGSSFAEVRVRPGIEGWIPRTSGSPSGWDDERAWTQVRQVVFVPQPPATVVVFRVGIDPDEIESPSGSGAGRLPL
ncbi:MAG: hypothetical protein RIE77_08720 [Phycisphaerales bacterium]|jgi:type II secretory pathway pseudopilin PulG